MGGGRTVALMLVELRLLVCRHAEYFYHSVCRNISPSDMATRFNLYEVVRRSIPSERPVQRNNLIKLYLIIFDVYNIYAELRSPLLLAYYSARITILLSSY